MGDFRRRSWPPRLPESSSESVLAATVVGGCSRWHFRSNASDNHVRQTFQSKQTLNRLDFYKSTVVRLPQCQRHFQGASQNLHPCCRAVSTRTYSRTSIWWMELSRGSGSSFVRSLTQIESSRTPLQDIDALRRPKWNVVRRLADAGILHPQEEVRLPIQG